MIYIAIVDDKKTIRNTLEEKLNVPGQLKVLFTAQNGREFLELMTECRKAIEPSVVLMDIDMPLMSGIEAVSEGKKRYPNTKYLMLTIFDEDEKIFSAIKAGADGYLLKDESSDKIKEAILNLENENGAPMSPSIARRALKLLMNVETNFMKAEPALKLDDYCLTAREKEVLKFLTDGLEYKEIGQHMNISPNTIRNHITKVYKKLHVSSQAQAMKLFQKNN